MIVNSFVRFTAFALIRIESQSVKMGCNASQEPKLKRSLSLNIPRFGKLERNDYELTNDFVELLDKHDKMSKEQRRK